MPHDHRLLLHGFLLLLLGLLTGLIAYPLENPAPWQEALLAASPIVGVLPPLLCGALAVWGLRRRANPV